MRFDLGEWDQIFNLEFFTYAGQQLNLYQLFIDKTQDQTYSLLIKEIFFLRFL